MDQWDYVLQFAAAGVEQQRVERERIAAKLAGAATVAPALAAHSVVLDARPCDVDDAPASARRLAGAGAAAGWRVRLRWALAADPRRGLVESVTVRLTRHDERCWAAWHNGRFDCAWYFSSDASLERLVGERMSERRPRGMVRISAMTVAQIKTLAKDHGIKVPSKYRRDEIVAYVQAAGLMEAIQPAPLRGVLDAVEGIQLTRQVVDTMIGR